MKNWKSYEFNGYGGYETRFKECDAVESDVMLKEVEPEMVEVGGIYCFTSKMENGITQKMIKVTFIDDMDAKDAYYVGVRGLSENTGKFGASRIYKNKTNKFGVVKIERAYKKIK